MEEHGKTRTVTMIPIHHCFEGKVMPNALCILVLANKLFLSVVFLCVKSMHDRPLAMLFNLIIVL